MSWDGKIKQHYRSDIVLADIQILNLREQQIAQNIMYCLSKKTNIVKSSCDTVFI